MATGGSWREILMDEAGAGGGGWVRGWRLCLVVAGPAVVAWLAVAGAWLGGIATIGVRHAGDTPWWGVYGSKTPRWRGLAAVFGRGWACCGGVAGGCGWVRGGNCDHRGVTRRRHAVVGRLW